MALVARKSKQNDLVDLLYPCISSQKTGTMKYEINDVPIREFDLLTEEPEGLREKLETLILAEWKVFDPFARVTSKLREDGKIDFTIISERFASMDGLQREAFFWQSFKDVPKTDLVRMTYGLLMTPEEAKRFSTSCMNRNEVPADEWEE